MSASPTERIVLAGGCFWCLEAVYQEVRGVRSVRSGYAGGTVLNPTYEQVCGGRTGHAEVVEVEFDPATVSLHDLLSIFFSIHDPTTRDRQGADVGTQYRSAIFFAGPAQREEALRVMEEIRAEKLYRGSIVTEVVPLGTFYPAEAYHQNYYRNHPEQGYCSAVISPKLGKFRAKFQDRLTRPGR